LAQWPIVRVLDLEREQLNEWARKKGEAGVRRYWADKNRFSIDGIPTHIVDPAVDDPES